MPNIERAQSPERHGLLTLTGLDDLTIVLTLIDRLVSKFSRRIIRPPSRD